MSWHKVMLQVSTLIVTTSIATSTFAIQVYDGNSESNNGGLTKDQRISRMERQLNYFQQMDFAARIDQLQQEIQSLRGSIEILNHQLAETKKQQRANYLDLDNRMSGSKIQTADNKSTAANPMTSSDSHPALNKNATDDAGVYENAYGLIQAKNYPKAILAMQHYVKTFPDGKFLVNAHYWLGELYALENKNQQAMVEFQTVVDKYPNNAKHIDALLKIGLIHAEKGNEALAIKSLQAVIKQAPNSTAARLAKSKLQHLKEGASINT